MKNIATSLVLLLIYCTTSCTSKTVDPKLRVAQDRFSEILSLIAVPALNKDSLRMKARDLDADELNHLVGSLEEHYGEVIAKSRAAKEREGKIKAQFDLKDGFHIKTKYAVQQSMDDPDSFVHEGTTHVDKGDTIYVSMRFKMRDPNGMIKSYLIESKVDLDGNVLDGAISPRG